MKAWRHLNIAFGLINVPVGISPLVEPSGISGSYVCSEHHNKLTTHYDCPNCEGVIPERVKAYTNSKGEAVILTEGDLPTVPKSDHTLKLDTFIPVTEVDPVYFNKTYILYPKNNESVAEVKGFKLLQEALSSTDLAAVGSVLLDKSPVPALVRYSPVAGTIVLHTCHYQSELSETKLNTVLGYQTGVDVPTKELDMGKAIIQSAVSSWDITVYSNEYADSLKEVIEGKKQPRSKKKAKTQEADPGKLIEEMFKGIK